MFWIEFEFSKSWGTKIKIMKINGLSCEIWNFKHETTNLYKKNHRNQCENLKIHEAYNV